METNRWKATIVLGSDHAGINRELGRLEREMLRVLSRVDDPRKVRDFIFHLRAEADGWCYDQNVDTRGWQERTRKKRA